jgi:serine/threonine protein phosphatase PrpC
MAAEEIRFSLLPGDLIVMISDGVSQSFEDGVWLLSLLSEDTDPTAPLSYLAHRILDEAKRKNQRSDDMTVELIRIAEETDTVKKKAPAPSTR